METRRGLSFWKFNSSPSEDDQYISLMTEKYSYMRKEGIDIDDPGEHDNVGNIFNVTFNYGTEH